VRGELSNRRAEFISTLFKKIAPSGEISTDEFTAIYDISKVESYKNGT